MPEEDQHEVKLLEGETKARGRGVARDNVAAKVSKTLNKRQCQHWQTTILTKHFTAHLSLSRSLSVSVCLLPVSAVFGLSPKCRKKKINAIELRTQSNRPSVIQSLSLSVSLVTQARTQYQIPSQIANPKLKLNQIRMATFGFCTLSFHSPSLSVSFSRSLA